MCTCICQREGMCEKSLNPRKNTMFWENCTVASVQYSTRYYIKSIFVTEHVIDTTRGERKQFISWCHMFQNKLIPDIEFVGRDRDLFSNL